MLIAQITDPHIGFDPGPLAGQIDPPANLRRALALVRQWEPKVEILLLTGDLVDSGKTRDYELIAELLRAELPTPSEGGPQVLTVPGNHDLRANMRAILGHTMPVAHDAPPDRICLHLEHGGLHLIGLDTVVAGAPHGVLERSQLDWLARRLDACTGAPVMIFMHHPPLVSGMAAMDACGLLQGRAELGKLIAAHGGVQMIACGHIHRPITGSLGGAPIAVVPSVSHQLTLDLAPQAPVAVRLEPPMIGLFRFTPADGMVCHLSHVLPFGPSYPV